VRRKVFLRSNTGHGQRASPFLVSSLRNGLFGIRDQPGPAATRPWSNCGDRSATSRLRSTATPGCSSADCTCSLRCSCNRADWFSSRCCSWSGGPCDFAANSFICSSTGACFCSSVSTSHPDSHNGSNWRGEHAESGEQSAGARRRCCSRTNTNCHPAQVSRGSCASSSPGNAEFPIG
jgi:hypothetical protein